VSEDSIALLAEKEFEGETLSEEEGVIAAGAEEETAGENIPPKLIEFTEKGKFRLDTRTDFAELRMK
jgi:hypothetical protein